MIRVTETIVLDESEIQERFIRSSGPGGQNVKKVSTAGRLRFDVRHSRSPPGAVRERLVRLAGKRMTGEGVLILEARRFRTQERNRQDARDPDPPDQVGICPGLFEINVLFHYINWSFIGLFVYTPNILA